MANKFLIVFTVAPKFVLKPLVLALLMISCGLSVAADWRHIGKSKFFVDLYLDVDSIRVLDDSNRVAVALFEIINAKGSEESTLSVREMARIQSFPDNFVFRSKVTTGGTARRFQVPQYTQVGNAVPPVLGRALGLAIKNLLLRIK